MDDEYTTVIHAYDGEPCELGLDPIDSHLCGHGFSAAIVYTDTL